MMEGPGTRASDGAIAELGRVLNLNRLSPAERRVLELALDGRSVRRIAEALVVSESTVHSHLTRIYRKLELRGRLDLLAKVAEVSPPSVRHANPTRPSHDRLPIGFAAVVAVAAVLAGFLVPVSALASSPALLVSGFYLHSNRRSSVRTAGWVLAIAGVLLLFIGVLLTLAVRVG